MKLPNVNGTRVSACMHACSCIYMYIKNLIIRRARCIVQCSRLISLAKFILDSHYDALSGARVFPPPFSLRQIFRSIQFSQHTSLYLVFNFFFFFFFTLSGESSTSVGDSIWEWKGFVCGLEVPITAECINYFIDRFFLSVSLSIDRLVFLPLSCLLSSLFASCFRIKFGHWYQNQLHGASHAWTSFTLWMQVYNPIGSTCKIHIKAE